MQMQDPLALNFFATVVACWAPCSTWRSIASTYNYHHKKMPLDLIAHGVVLAASIKAAPFVLAKAGGAVHGAAAAKGGLLAATKAKVGGCASFTGKGTIQKDLHKLEHDLESMDKDLLMMPFALASPMTLFGKKDANQKATDQPRQVRRTQRNDRQTSYGNFL
ncbi:hypothetical protein Esti_004249 [Eimeria stiedai]